VRAASLARNLLFVLNCWGEQYRFIYLKLLSFSNTSCGTSNVFRQFVQSGRRRLLGPSFIE
jgi:hypothetical protein